MKVFKVISVLLFFNFCAISFAQDNAMQQLIRGKKFFWEAKFDNAIAALNNVLSNIDARPDFLFEANVYIGFILIRRYGPSLEADSYFERAVRLDPNRELDAAVIPPDLINAFKFAKEKLYTCVYVISDPAGAVVTVVKGDSVGMPQKAPVQVCDLMESPVQILIKKEGFDGQLLPLILTGGAVDTLRVVLVPSRIRRPGEGGSKLWAWLVRGGVVASAGTLLYLTIVDNSQEADSGLLPSPPDRPTN